MANSDSFPPNLERPSQTSMTRRSLLSSASALALGTTLGATRSSRALAQIAHLDPRQGGINRSVVVADRWLELDLYWFRQPDLEGSARQFWRRYLPLYAGLEGYCGIILSVAWTVGPVMEWSGDLQQKVTLPSGTGHSLEQPVDGWVPETGPLTGTVEEQKRQWKARFAEGGAIGTKRRPSDKWTYADLKNLSTALKQEAERNGIPGFKVGMFNTGGRGAYGELAPWAARHPEVFLPHFDPNARLHADSRRLGGLPDGIPAGMPMHEAYAAQWGSLSKAVGFDAILFRDMVGLPTVYKRGGPWGPVAPSSALIASATEGVAALIRETKLANPETLVMMYSNGASAVADWRANGLDLESVARQGFLDIFIDQSWSGSWNEVGVRRKSFWNSPVQGWTYQLAYILLHAVVLAETKVRHYPLVETFDAWEDWDVLHSVPEKLRWAIWAYSHAAVKTPKGLKCPAGSYISWCNRGDNLLSEEDVRFLECHMNAAFADARRTTQVFGPTLVYSRESMQWQAKHAEANTDVKEWIDEQAGTVIKWPIPILSITRVEWLPQVQSDLFILQTPSHLTREHTTYIAQLIEKGQPIAIFGNPVEGVDEKLRKLAGLSGTGEQKSGAIQKYLAATDSHGQLAHGVPSSFFTIYSLAAHSISGEARVVYSVDGVPELIVNRAEGKRVAMWDPPELLSRVSSKSPLMQVVKAHVDQSLMVRLDGQLDLPLSQLWGDTGAPYALMAGVLNNLLSGIDALHVTVIDLRQTMTLLAWSIGDADVRILAGNLETGIREDADMSRHTTLVIPRTWNSGSWQDTWRNGSVKGEHNELQIDLKQAASVLLKAQR